jgi:YHYH protein
MIPTKDFPMKTFTILAAIILTSVHSANADDPRTNSWVTGYSGKYARLYETDAELAAGSSKTTWSRNSVSQNLPAYSGVQAIYSSSNWVYVSTSGLGLHTMGPWYNDATRSPLFVNIPANQKALARFPRSPTVPVTKTVVQGEGGYFVDGVIMFDARDAVSYINSTGADGSPPGAGTTGDGIWNRDAYENEGVTFDPALAHQQNTGVYHYHANPIATRYLLGDHVDFKPGVTNGYSESTNEVTRHSPIVGWAKDGFPIYGPYGYASASNSASGLRRMVSGYVRRNGLNGTTNLAAMGRKTLPAWAARITNRSTTLAANEYGPNVSTSFPLGRYTEDNDYLGDLGQVQGVGFDLDEYNGRYCVTPEFPNGTYAYFVCLTTNGLPMYPYNIGRQYFGSPTGGTRTSITEAVVTNFMGGANSALQLSTPNWSNSIVTLAWSAVEGGTYRVESSSELTSWSTNASGISAARNAGGYTNASPEDAKFFRVARTALASYDAFSVNIEDNSGAIPVVAPGGSASQGTKVIMTITLPNSPPQPPADIVPVSVTLGGSNPGTSISRPSIGTVQATFTLTNAPGLQNIVIVFNPGPTYTLTGAFTVN